MTRLPPERLDLGDVVLRRDRVGDEQLLVPALVANLEHLRPWMPWATPDGVTADVQRARLQHAEQLWDECKDHGFLLWDAAESAILGGFGLHRRIGPDAIEIGYWVTADVQGRGYATLAAGALTKAALDLDDVSRVEIHCDEANVRSARVPERVGYRLDRVEPDEIKAPGEIGRSMIWVYPPNVLQAAGSPDR